MASEQVEPVLALLRSHVEHVRHYLHLQIGRPVNANLISAPEIALNSLASVIACALNREITLRKLAEAERDAVVNAALGAGK